LAGWNEENVIQLKLHKSVLGQDQMCVVRRVERTANHP
jgi:hypothetical protein